MHESGDQFDVIDHRLRELVELYCDQQASTAQVRELEDLLYGDRAAQLFYAAYMQQHAQLQWVRRGAHSYLSPTPTPPLATLDDDALPPATIIATAPRRAWWQSQPAQFSFGFAALTIVSLLLTMAQFHWRPENPMQFVPEAPAPRFAARLLRTEQAEWGAGTPPLESGYHLGTGAPLVLRQGLAEIRCHNGARLLLEGPAELSVLAEDTVRLERGQLTAFIPEQAVGFSVITPTARVIDLGTEFGVSVGPNATEVHVFTGQVRVEPRDQRHAPLLVTAGSAAAWLSAEAPPKLAKANPRQFRREFVGVRPELNVALGRPIVAASGSWQTIGLVLPDHPFSPQRAVDGVTTDRAGAYWIGIDRRADEFFVIDLQKIRRLQRIELINTHSANYQDRGSKDCELWISTEIFNGELVAPKLLCTTTLADVRGSGPDLPVHTVDVWTTDSKSPPPEARFVKFVAKTYYGHGAGLNEIRVFGAPDVMPSPEASGQVAAREPGVPEERTAEPAESSADYILSLKPLAYYQMSADQNLTLVDSSSAQRHGVVHFGPQGFGEVAEEAWRPGRFGTELYSPGITSPVYAIAPYAPADTNQLSVAAWVKAENRTDWGIIASNWAEGVGGQFHFGLHGNLGDIKITVRQRNGTAIGVSQGLAGRLRLGVWEHVAFTANGIRLQLYRNGRYVGYARCLGVARPSLPVLSLGAITNREGTAAPPPDAAWYWQGSLDEVAIFDRALSADEIERMYRLSEGTLR